MRPFTVGQRLFRRDAETNTRALPRSLTVWLPLKRKVRDREHAFTRHARRVRYPGTTNPLVVARKKHRAQDLFFT